MDSDCVYPGSLLPVSDGSPTVGPGWRPRRSRRHWQDRDHQGPGQVPGQAVCRLQLLRRSRLQGEPFTWLQVFMHMPVTKTPYFTIKSHKSFFLNFQLTPMHLSSLKSSK